MDSINQYRRMDSDDEDSSESDHSMEQPPSAEDLSSGGAPPDASLTHITNAFILVFDSNISDLNGQRKRLVALTESVEKLHRNTTIGSLSGGVIGAVGGITSIVGLILTPFTLGASLIVTGVGIGVATAGGLTGAGSNITEMVHQRSLRKGIEETLNTFQDKLSPIIECVKNLELGLGEIQRSELTDSNIFQAAIGIGRGLGYAAEGARLLNFVELGKIAAQASRAVKVAGAITGVFSGLFLLLDIFFIVKESKELIEINKEQKDGNEKSDTVKFVQGMRKACHDLKQAVKEIKKLRQNINPNLNIQNPNLQEQNWQ